MKKFLFKTTLMLLPAVAVTACSDEEREEIPINEVSEYGIFDGTRVCQWYVEDGELIIPIKSDRDHDIENIETTLEDKFPNVDIDVKVVDGHRCLVVNSTNIDKSNLPITINIQLKDRTSATRSSDAEPQTVSVVLRSKYLESSYDDMYENDCIREAWGCGMSMAEEIGGINKKERIFDFDQIYQYLAANDFSGRDGTPYTKSYMLSGSDYEEMTRQYAFNLGISGSRALNKEWKLVGGKALSGSFTGAVDLKTHAAEYYEFTVFITKARRLSMKLRSFMDYSDEKLISYLCPKANDVLNNPNSEEYKYYSNTREGIFNLFDTYGTHVMTSCVWGGRFVYVYFRKNNAYTNSTATSFAVNVGLKKKNDQITYNPEMPYASFMVQQMASSGINIDFGLDTYAEDIQETTSEDAYTMAIGGNANNMDPNDWMESMDPDKVNAKNYALIGLDEPTTENAKSGGLISLSCLCLDKERREAMEKYYEEYLEERAPLKGEIPSMVLADVIMLKDSDDGNGGVDPTKQRVMTDPFGKKRLYTPMYVNNNGVEKVLGQAVDTSCDVYITVVDACDQFWYAAIDYPTECNGISDICFSDKKESSLANDGYTRRGSRADDEMNWGAIDNNYLVVKYIKDGDTTTPKITGFGLMHAQGDDNNIDKAGGEMDDIFATSVGTEMRFPFAADINFDYHWQDWKHSDYSKRSWWGENNATRKHIYPVYTTTKMKDRPTPDKIGLPTGPGH